MQFSTVTMIKYMIKSSSHVTLLFRAAGTVAATVHSSRFCFLFNQTLPQTAKLSTMVKAKKLLQVKTFDELPKETDFKIFEEELPPIKDGEFLCQAEYFSVDPYLRVHHFELANGGCAAEAGQVAKIIESKNDKFPVGSHVVGYLGWRSHTVVSDPKKGSVTLLATKVFDGFPTSYALGALGMPGMTSYFGFLEYCLPKAGETVVVSTAAGAVGSLVGQIAKIKGCKVIGYAGSDDKLKWLKELGFDYAFNYKKVDLDKSLKQSAPNGVDCYFDNVGGDFATTVAENMALNGRISVCGAIAVYNDKDGNPTKAKCLQLPVISKRLTMKGFLIFDYAPRFPEGIVQMATWLKEGKLKYKETITEGFANTPKAFIELLQGLNTGKAVVKV